MSLRVNIAAMMRVIERKRAQINASVLRPEMERSAKRVLRTCIDKTPIRGEGKIATNQKRQYVHRVNYIPSVHDHESPTLIVNDAGEHWLRVGEKWYAASYRALPQMVEGIYNDLLAERERRLQTTEGDFVKQRVQARFLYRKSWWECARSAGLSISIDPRIPAAVTRRKPVENPPKGYAQWRGGRETLTVVFYNPFLEKKSRYKPFSGIAILNTAIENDRQKLQSEAATKLQRILDGN